MDYILLVPSEEFTHHLLEEETFDQTKEFIQKCGQDHFHIRLNASEFCKQAVFSLTSDYNNGALPCNCDYSGSTSFECDPFGGQCQCKNNVIGRQCEACRTGFYGKNFFYSCITYIFNIASCIFQAFLIVNHAIVHLLLFAKETLENVFVHQESPVKSVTNVNHILLALIRLLVVNCVIVIRWE